MDPAAGPHPHPPLDVILGVLQSVVTVVLESHVNGPAYRTGVIIADEEDYTAIYAKDGESESGGGKLQKKAIRLDKIYVYFHVPDQENFTRVKFEAELIVKSTKFAFIVLAVRKNKEGPNLHGPAIQLGSIFSSDDEAQQRMMIYTIGTMSGIKVNPFSMDENLVGGGVVDQAILGGLGVYVGAVDTPDCTSWEINFLPNTTIISRHVIEETRNYFKFSCQYKDQLVDLDNVHDDADKHTSKCIVGAPVVASDGKMVGIVYSSSLHCDQKIGLHTDSMKSQIKDLCCPPSLAPDLSWMDALKLYCRLKLGAST